MVFVALAVAATPLVIRAFGFHVGLALMGSALTLAAIGFGTGMFWLLDRAHQTVVETERTSAALTERERIARELHDSLAQVLGVTHLRLAALAARPSLKADPRTLTEIDELTAICHEAYRDVREAILGLKDSAHAERTLLEQIDAHITTFARTSAIPTELVTTADALAVAPTAEAQVLRVVQEALTNVRKHSGATRASVEIRVLGQVTEFVIADDGCGFDLAMVPCDGYGLSAMRERIDSVGGHLHIASRPGAGTRVMVRVPGLARPLPPSEELSA